MNGHRRFTPLHEVPAYTIERWQNLTPVQNLKKGSNGIMTPYYRYGMLSSIPYNPSLKCRCLACETCFTNWNTARSHFCALEKAFRQVTRRRDPNQQKILDRLEGHPDKTVNAEGHQQVTAHALMQEAAKLNNEKDTVVATATRLLQERDRALKERDAAISREQDTYTLLQQTRADLAAAEDLLAEVGKVLGQE